MIALNPFSTKVSVLLIMKCASCKNKTSDEQCPNKTLKGLIFCGKHARVKNTRLWADNSNLNETVIPIQKIWRGYRIRNILHLAGPGVLNRKLCHNDEELVSMEEKKTVSPLNYFAFEESGKNYWFDIRSIIEISVTNINPTNPYTRTPLTIETRQRLRKLTIKRIRSGLPILHTKQEKSYSEITTQSWITICQIIVENGFFDMSPNYFTFLNKTQLNIFVNLIYQDMIIWSLEHKDKNSLRYRYIKLLKRLGVHTSSHQSTQQYSSYIISKILLAILTDYPEPYPICFIIMSSLHRL